MPVKYRIHPAIGIARVGDSPDDFFIGPEAPGIAPTLNKPDGSSSQPGKYKDKNHRIKRQGARFRIYEYTEDAAGKVTKVREITAADADVEWQVHLVNRKAAEKDRFFSVGNNKQRNKDVKDRNKLIIDPGSQRIGGVNQPMKRLQGKFMDTVDVKLGDLLTDSGGRLIVLGGHGKSQSHDGRRLSDSENDFADNDGWCDDTSDGAIEATVKLKGGNASVAADPAWVIVAPPDFAPPIENVVTLYDVVYDVAAKFDPSLAVTDATKISFTKDIYPILRRVSNMHWVSDFAALGHGQESFGHFISRIDELAGNDPQDQGRKSVFRRLQNPKGRNTRDMNMPKLATARDIPGVCLTAVQYRRMERWAAGNFVADWPGAEPAPIPLDKLPETDRPHALDRAALESCVGGPFFPGIEVGEIMLGESPEKQVYDKSRPFRINSKLPPGTLTARMAVPWQADFFACETNEAVSMDWWPGQRPDQVLRGSTRKQWRLGISSMNEMVEKWAELGFIVENKQAGKVEYVEAERTLAQPALVA